MSQQFTAKQQSTLRERFLVKDEDQVSVTFIDTTAFSGSELEDTLDDRYLRLAQINLFATAAQGAKADSALQPGDAATAAQGALASTAVQPSRTITAGTGLTGGGDLSANRTISLNSSSIASLALADSSVQPARSVSAGTGLTGGGDLSANRTISLSSSSIASLALADTALQSAPVLKLSYQTGLTSTAITLPATPATGSNVIVFKNKLMLREGASDDYTISGAAITLALAAVAGDKFDIYYMA